MSIDSELGNPSRRELLAALGSAALGSACGGGGGGPTSPGTPTPPPAGNATIAGRLVNLETGLAIPGCMAAIGSKTGQTDGSGNYRLEGIAGGAHIVTFTGPIVERKAKLNVNANATNNYPAINALPSDFPLEFFDVVCRHDSFAGQAISKATVRWTSKPEVYCDVDSLRTLPYSWRVFEGELRRQVETNFGAMTNGFLAGTPIHFVGGSQMPAKETPGVLHVSGERGMSHAAEMYAKASGNSITTAVVLFGSAVYAHAVCEDMLQTLGFTYDYPGAGADSVFWNAQTVILNDPTPKDLRMGRYLYSRVGGTKGPDDTSEAETISPLQ